MMIKLTLSRLFYSLSLVMLLGFGQLAQASTPALHFTDINGKPVNLEDYRGKWVVVNYWANWCPPCLEEIPELVLFHENHKDHDAVVVGFNMEEKKPRRVLSRFVEENMMTYPVIPMSDDMTLIGNIPGLPTTYLIDPSGKPVAMQVGEVTMKMLEDYIKNNKTK
jgi:thiol-disulfide isomerase/thioredoxin